MPCRFIWSIKWCWSYLYNYGTITSAHETIWLGSGASGNHRSKGLKICNYDGGIIKTTGTGDSPIKAFHLVDFEFVNYEGGTIEGATDTQLNTEQSEDVNFTNHGTITAADKVHFIAKHARILLSLIQDNVRWK